MRRRLTLVSNCLIKIAVNAVSNTSLSRCVLYITDGRCSPVPEFNNAVYDTKNATNGTIVTYTCIEGFVFYGTHKQVIVNWCDGVSWNVTFAACVRE